MRKTKIICTLGPSSSSVEVIRELALAGMNVARFNFSHGSHDSQLATFKNLVKVRNELELPIATLLDTKGPEIRLREFEGGAVVLEAGQTFTLRVDEIMGNQNEVTVSYAHLPQDLEVGKHVLLDDGLLELEVIELHPDRVVCKVLTGGRISNRKGVNLPGTRVSMPYISEADREDVLFGIRTGFDIVAASFVRTKDDVMQMRQLLDDNGGSHIRILSKIENAEGVENIDDIIALSDAIMIARGDMGVEVPLEEIPIIQKSIIKKTIAAGRQVVTATQMLESMVNNPRPTRAETTDVANAIYDGTSATMLSGETANGKYPVEAVRTMALIAERAENDIDYEKRFFSQSISDAAHDITDAISHATCLIAYNLGAKAMITVTQTGSTARMISRFRCDIPIIACTPSASTLRQMSLSWGVRAIMVGEERVTDVLFDSAVNGALHAGLVAPGDLVVLTAGVPLATAGTTNLIKVIRVE